MLGEGLQTTREDLIVLGFFLRTLDDPVNAAAVAIAVVRRFLPAGDQAGIERLIQYMTGCPFRLSPLVKVRDTGQVVYQAEKQACRAFPDPKGDACAGRSEAEFPDPGATRFPGAASPATGYAAHSAARLAADSRAACLKKGSGTNGTVDLKLCADSDLWISAVMSLPLGRI